MRKLICLIAVMILTACSGVSTAATSGPGGGSRSQTPPPAVASAAIPSPSPAVSSSPTSSPSPTTTPFAPSCPAPGNGFPAGNGRLRIAFAGGERKDSRDRGLNAWLWTEGEAAALLPNSGNAKWIGFSGDGEYLAYTRESTQNVVELWAGRTGGEAARLVTPEWFSKMGKHPDRLVVPMDLHWVPGTHKIGFHTNLAGTYLGFFYTPDNLWWVDAETGKAVPKPVDGEVFYSPDGTLAAVVNQKHMFLMNADGTDPRHVELENYHTIQYGTTYAEPPRIHWAGDSRSVFVIAPEAESFVNADPDAQVTIWKVTVEDAKAVRYARFDSGNCSVIAFSSDHRWAAYWQPVAGGSNRRALILSEADGSRSTIYQQGEMISNVAWSSDSIHFIFWMESTPYLGSVCGAPVPLMESAPKDPSTRRPAVDYQTKWIDPVQFILAAGGMLFHGSLSGPAIVWQLLPDFYIQEFSWRWIG